jgi:Fe2+ transport system protein FeoA
LQQLKSDSLIPSETAHSIKAAITLDCLSQGVSARVAQVQGSGALTRRLMEMGVMPGAPVRVVKVAPLGDPIQICVRNYHLALRRDEARTILVVKSSL